MAQPVSPLTRQRQSRAQLSLKQQRFVKEYAHLGNATEAARRAGYKQTNSISQIAHKNLRKPLVASAIREEIQRIEVEVTPQRVQRRLDEIGRAAQDAGQFGPAVRAEELLGKTLDRTLLRRIFSYVWPYRGRLALSGGKDGVVRVWQLPAS